MHAQPAHRHGCNNTPGRDGRERVHGWAAGGARLQCAGARHGCNTRGTRLQPHLDSIEERSLPWAAAVAAHVVREHHKPYRCQRAQGVSTRRSFELDAIVFIPTVGSEIGDGRSRRRVNKSQRYSAEMESAPLAVTAGTARTAHDTKNRSARMRSNSSSYRSTEHQLTNTFTQRVRWTFARFPASSKTHPARARSPKLSPHD